MVKETTNDQHSALLAAWLEGDLSKEQQVKFEMLCTQDENFADLVEQANFVKMLSDTNNELEAPKWNKEQSFHYSETTKWWQWQGLPITAMLCSVFAMFMVISDFNINAQNGRFSMGFGNSLSPQEIEQIVQNRLNEQQVNNQQMFSQYMDSLQQQQLQTSSQLTEYLLTSSRQQRREDFAELIEFVNQQRYDDQVFYARQLNELQQEINAQTGLQIDTLRPVSDLSFNE